jgi:hypothetical protein
LFPSCDTAIGAFGSALKSLSLSMNDCADVDCARVVKDPTVVTTEMLMTKTNATVIPAAFDVILLFIFYYPSPSSSTIAISSASPLPRVPLAASIIKGPNVAPSSLLTLATGMSLV